MKRAKKGYLCVDSSGLYNLEEVCDTMESQCERVYGSK